MHCSTPGSRVHVGHRMISIPTELSNHSDPVYFTSEIFVVLNPKKKIT